MGVRYRLHANQTPVLSLFLLLTDGVMVVRFSRFHKKVKMVVITQQCAYSHKYSYCPY